MDSTPIKSHIMSERDRVAAALSGVSTVRSTARPGSPSTPRQFHPEPRTQSRCARDKKCSIKYDNGTGVLSPRIQAQIDAKSKSQHTPSLSAATKKPLPTEPLMISTLHGRESFTLADVPARRAQPGRAAYVQSMAVSTHSGRTTIPPPPPSRNPNDETPSPINTANQSSRRLTQLRETSPFTARHPTNIRNFSANAPLSPTNRIYTYPALAHSSLHSRPITSFPNTSHPSTRILLLHLPPHHFVFLSSFLLSALESATLPPPAKPSRNSNTTPCVPVPWYTTWPLTPPPPLSRRTLYALRTTNSLFQTIQKNNHPNPLRTGQLSHLAAAVPFRWTKRTQKHGLPTDYSHPGYGKVGAARALWVKGYRDEAYCGVKVGEGREVRGGKRRSRWEGHWLKRGGVRGVRLREERADGLREVEDWEVEDEDEDGDGGSKGVEMDRRVAKWRQDVEAGKGKLKKMGSTFGGGVVRMASNLGRGKKEDELKHEVKKAKEKRVYKPVPPEQDHSGWYTDSDEEN